MLKFLKLLFFGVSSKKEGNQANQNKIYFSFVREWIEYKVSIQLSDEEKKNVTGILNTIQNGLSLKSK